MKITMVEEDPEDRPCPHCGEPLEWMDLFGIKWCSKQFWGDGPLIEGEHP